jgi:hypothetical protein
MFMRVLLLPSSRCTQMMEEAGSSKTPDALLPEYGVTSQKSAVFNPCQESLKFHVSGCIVTDVLMFHQIDASNNKNNRITETTIYTECQISLLFRVWFNSLPLPWGLF